MNISKFAQRLLLGSSFVVLLLLVAAFLYFQQNFSSKNIPKKYQAIFEIILTSNPPNLRFDLTEYLASEQLTIAHLQQQQTHPSPLEQFYGYYLSGYQFLALNQYQSAIPLLKQAETIAKQTPSLFHADVHARLYFDLADTYFLLENYDLEQAYFEQLDLLNEQISSSYYFLNYYINRGFKYSKIEQYQQPILDFWLRTLDKAESITYDGLANIYHSVGLAYWYMQEYVQAIDYKLKALEQSLLNEDYQSAAFYTIDIGIDYLLEGNYHEAEYQLKEALSYDLSQYSDQAFIKQYAHSKLFLVYLETNQLPLAEYHLNHSKKALAKFTDPMLKQSYQTASLLQQAKFELASNHLESALALLAQVEQRHQGEYPASVYHFDLEIEQVKADIAYAQGHYQTAIEINLSLLARAEQLKLTYLKPKLSDKLAMSYHQQGELVLAIDYLKKQRTYYQQIQDLNSAQYTQYLHNQFLSEQSQLKIEQLEGQRSQLEKYVYTVCFILFVFSIFFVSVREKNKKIALLNQELAKLATTDPLTQIANRRAFDEYLLQLDQDQRQPQAAAMLMLDIDYFKKYNDYYGHGAGDKVIQAVAKALVSQCREQDLIARYGGEEFVILLNQCAAHDAEQIAQRILEQVRSLQLPHVKSEVADHVTISLGLLCYQEKQGQTSAQLLNLADQALYQAKAQGRNQYCCQQLRSCL